MNTPSLETTKVAPTHPTKFKMPVADSTPQTLYDKVFQAHIVDEKLDGTILLYIDRHLVHEVTSPVRMPDPVCALA